MDSDIDMLYDEVDSDNESIENDMDYIDSACSHLEIKNNENEEYSFQVLSPDEIVEHMTEFIRDVNSVLEMPETITRILLHHFKWDKQKLLDRFYDGNQDKLFQEAHIINPFKKSYKGDANILSQTSLPEQSSSDTAECEVCYLVLPASKLTGLECGHRFCTDCWNNYLRIKIMDEGITQTIECVGHKCEILVDDSTVMELVKDSKVKQKYQNLITNSFVDCNELMRWCSTPGCNRAIKVQYVDAKPVTCVCHLTVCFKCGKRWHEPISCDLLCKWERRCRDDIETSNWIRLHTKDCPNCHSTIEKNGGCNNMTCRKCHKSFCWLCVELWEKHDVNRGCNTFQLGEEENSIRSSIANAFQRYLFYSDRYLSHMASLRFEKTLYTNVKCKMEDMDEHKMSWVEVQFLKKAVDTLICCRQTLMYTYALAFYLEKNNQTAIFESNQQDLERAVEVLSGYLERDIVVENLADIKQRVLDKYVYCEGRRQTLLKHINEGHENGWLKYVGV